MEAQKNKKDNGEISQLYELEDGNKIAATLINGVRYSNNLCKEILWLMRRDRIEERAIGAINMYIMHPNSVFDATYTRPDAYTSRMLRRFRTTKELKQLAMKGSSAEQLLVRNLRKANVHVERDSKLWYLYIDKHRCLLETVAIPSAATIRSALCEFIPDVASTIDDSEIDPLYVYLKLKTKPFKRPRLFPSNKKSSDFMYMSKSEFMKKYKFETSEYNVKFTLFAAYVKRNKDFIFE